MDHKLEIQNPKVEESMNVKIYIFQISKKPNDLVMKLRWGMVNECPTENCLSMSIVFLFCF